MHQDLCANQDGPAIARCIKCRLPFCDHCAAYVVNGKPWCEPCGAAAIDEAKFPRWRIALAAIVFVFFGAIGVSSADSGRMRGFVGCMVAAVVLPLLILTPIGVADRPRIERRHPATGSSAAR